MGKADLHIHSAYGDGTATIEDILGYVERKTDLDLIAVTDHDNIEGSLRARELVAKGNYRFEVMVGMEITTLAGHLLALGIEKPIRRFLSLPKTIEKIHKQGGICIIPHPVSWLTRSIGLGAIKRVMNRADEGLYFDGLETFNPSGAGQIIFERVNELNQRLLGLPQFGGSDAHHLGGIGTGYTLFKGRTAADFIRSLRDKKTEAQGEFWTINEQYKIFSLQLKKYTRRYGRILSQAFSPKER